MVDDESELQSDAVRLQAKTLVRTANCGALGYVDQTDGAPRVTRAGIATLSDGSVVLATSGLSENLADAGRVSVLIGEFREGDALCDPHLSLNGCLTRLLDAKENTARLRYKRRHLHSEVCVDFEDVLFWRLEVRSACYLQELGQASNLRASDLECFPSDWDAWDAMEGGAVDHMNEDHLVATRLYATVFCGEEDAEWRLTGLDPEGIDMALGARSIRLNYIEPLEDPSALRQRLVSLVKEARAKLERTP